MHRYQLLKITVLAILLMAALSCGGDGQEQSWKTTKVLRIGTDATYPPFEMVNTESRKIEGFDIDIMEKICEYIGLTPEYIITPFDGIIAGLKGNKYDCIISAMTITPEREAIVDFTNSYYYAGQIIAVPLDDSTITGIDDLAGKMVGVQLGTTGEKYAKSLSGVTVVPFENIGAAFIDMENGRVDAVLNDYPTTMEYIHRQGSAKTIGELLSKESYGIAVRAGDKELRRLINNAITRIHSNGEFDAIREKWFRSGE